MGYRKQTPIARAIEACDPALTISCRCAVWDNGGDGYPQRVCNLTTLKRREQCLSLWIAGAAPDHCIVASAD